ncbi:hypothetical protein AAVH_20549 [Aphelenchoides avenae]|nr:hypothetical protein AAVH_20549 [Aphelenchus avenae]
MESERKNTQAARTKTADTLTDAAPRLVRDQRASSGGGAAMPTADRTADRRLEPGHCRICGKDRKGPSRESTHMESERKNTQAERTKTADTLPDAASHRIREQRASRGSDAVIPTADRRADGRLEMGHSGENGEHSTIITIHYHMSCGGASSLPKTAGN